MPRTKATMAMGKKPVTNESVRPSIASVSAPNVTAAPHKPTGANNKISTVAITIRTHIGDGGSGTKTAPQFRQYVRPAGFSVLHLLQINVGSLIIAISS